MEVNNYGQVGTEVHIAILLCHGCRYENPAENVDLTIAMANQHSLPSIGQI